MCPDLWITSLLFDLNYEFIKGASLLALAKSIYFAVSQYSRRSQPTVRLWNPVELQLYDWLRFGSVIELNRTHLKILPVKHNPGGGVLPYKGLMGMSRPMGSHFHDWIDYSGVAFSIALPEWGRTFSDFWGKAWFSLAHKHNKHKHICKQVKTGST